MTDDQRFKQEALFDLNMPQVPGLPKVVDTWREAIKCFSCSLKQVAIVKVYEGAPWADYTHTCSCGYTTTESEWQQVNWDEVKGAPRS